MNRNDVLALAARVEAATGADIHMDVMIWRACELKGDIDYYTASLDAALSLVPSGHAFDLSHWHPAYGTRANVLPLHQEGDRWLHHGDDPVHRAKAATPALALTSAALRAIAERMPE